MRTTTVTATKPPKIGGRFGFVMAGRARDPALAKMLSAEFERPSYRPTRTGSDKNLHPGAA